MSSDANTSYFYLRKYSPIDRGFHRFGCIAIGKTANPSVLAVAYSLCSRSDKFNAAYARQSAIGRLNSVKHSVEISLKDATVGYPNPIGYIIQSLNLGDKLSRNHPEWDYSRCSSALKGALLELQPKQQVAVKA